MERAANDVLMRATINNYVLKSQADNVIIDSFVNNDIFNTLTYKGEGGYYRLKNSSAITGIYLYTAVGDGQFPKNVCNPGEYCSSYDYKTRKVIVDEGLTFDPKSKPDDMIKLRDDYHGANRDDTITVRLEAKLNCKVFFIATNIDFQIPLVVEKSGPAMFYYRI